MKASAFLINVSRGAIVDEVALTRVLNDGGIAGAGLDVFSPVSPFNILYARGHESTRSRNNRTLCRNFKWTAGTYKVTRPKTS